MSFKGLVLAAVALLAAQPAASAEPQFYMRSMRSGVLQDARRADPEPPVAGPVTCTTFPKRGLVALQGFVAADWLFAESHLGCSLPAVAGSVTMTRAENSPLIGRRQISTPLVVGSCGLNAPEMRDSFSLGLEGKTIVFHTRSAPMPGRYGAAVTCFLETAAQPGIPVSVMLLPLEIVVPR